MRVQMSPLVNREVTRASADVGHIANSQTRPVVSGNVRNINNRRH